MLCEMLLIASLFLVETIQYVVPDLHSPNVSNSSGNSGRKNSLKTAQINTGTLSEKGSCGHNLTFSRHLEKNIFRCKYLQLHDCYD